MMQTIYWPWVQKFWSTATCSDGVLFLKRKKKLQWASFYDMLRQVVKLAFQQRRKTAINSLKSMELPEEMRERPFSLR
jgi:16S rRNA (adenine1518-N6/adenine1519-N6)-dimethyltransferase